MIDTDEIKQRIDIIDYISRYTSLKKSGRNYKGLCPFHTEKTPSFYVNPTDGYWRCYGACSEGGDIISFVMKKETLTFVEALRKLGAEVGIDIDRAMGDGSGGKRSTIYEINEAAAQYFRTTLLSSPGAQEARDYLSRRGIDDATAERFSIGYAPESWNGLRDYLTEMGFDHELQLEAGVIKRHEEKGNLYDAFRHRVITPIRDRLERVIGFGGRVLDDSQPKYLNTAETPVFHKARVIYGIEHAYQAIREADEVVIVEGYMDVIAAHQHGYANVVACMGTSLTAEQLQQLQRYTSRFVLALDADSAGQQATVRGLNQAREALSRKNKPVASSRGMRFEQRLSAELYIASMPEGMDPDDLIRHDPEQWPELIGKAVPLVDYFFNVVSKREDLSTAAGKKEIVGVLSPLIAELSDEIERQHYINKLSDLVKIDELTIASRVQAASIRNSQPANVRSRYSRQRNGSRSRNGFDESPRQPNRYNAPPDSRGSGGLDQAQKREDYLLSCLLVQPDAIYWLSEQAVARDLNPPATEDWRNMENQEIYRAMKQYLSGDEQWEMEVFQHRLDAPLHGRLKRLLAEAEDLPPLSDGSDMRNDLLKVLVRMRIDYLKNEIMAIRFVIVEAQREVDKAAMRSFDMINNRYLKELNHLQSTLSDLTQVIVQQRRNHHRIGVGFR